MMQNSPEIASLLNINRIIIVPNQMGLDDLGSIGKGPITHYITSLPAEYNIYDLFASDYKAERIAYQLKSAEYKDACQKRAMIIFLSFSKENFCSNTEKYSEN